MAKTKKSPYSLHPLSLQSHILNQVTTAGMSSKLAKQRPQLSPCPRPQDSVRVDRHGRRRRPPRLYPQTNFPAPGPSAPAPGGLWSRRVPPSPPGSLEATHPRRAQQQQQQQAEARVAPAHAVAARCCRPRSRSHCTATGAPRHWLGGFGTGA